MPQSKYTSNWIHGLSTSPEYKAWSMMKWRCLNPNCNYYKNYGGRGITICERWLNFENFYADMGKKPTPNHTLDRIDNNKGYEKDNCRWATKTEQAGNRRNVAKHEWEGRVVSTAELARIRGLHKATLHARLNKYRMSLDEAVFHDKYTHIDRSRR